MLFKIMKKKRIASLLLLLPLFVCCTVKEPTEASKPIMPESPEDVVPGEAIVLLSKDAADSFDPAANLKILNDLGVTSMERLFPDGGEFEGRHRASGLNRWYIVHYDPEIPQTKAKGDLSSIPGVETVMPQPRYKKQSVFNDPLLSKQWPLINDGTLGKDFKPGLDINVLPVWEQFTGGSRDVIVAVIDGGVQIDHPDLEGVVLTAEEGSRNFVFGHTPQHMTADEHGTHVAGTIAAINNNGTDVAGVAGGLDGNGGVRIMSCIVVDEDDNWGQSAPAMVWAADHGAVIANNSWGKVTKSQMDAANKAAAFVENPSPVRDAIDYFIQYAGLDADGNQTGPMKGGLVVFSAGNNGFQYGIPACYEPVVAVGSFGPTGRMAQYSNYGPWVDILAPGGSDSSDENEWVLSLAPKNGTQFMSGTSMAAPHVSGVAALLVSHFGGPGFTVDDLKEALTKGAVPDVIDILDGRSVGGGKLDAYGAFIYLQDPKQPSKSDIIFSTEYEGDWQLKSHEALDFLVNIKGNNRAQLPVNVRSDCPAVTASCSINQAQIHIDAFQASPGKYTVTVSVGTLAEKSYSFSIMPNQAPQQIAAIEDVILNAASTAVTELDLSRYIVDPDGEVLHFNVSADDRIITVTPSGNTLLLKSTGYGETTVILRASDAHDASVETSFRILSRNTFLDIDIFPNPVSDKLTIRPGNNRTISVELVNSVGATVFSTPSEQVGPFNPFSIDMSEMAGGIYALSVDGKKYSIVKK